MQTGPFWLLLACLAGGVLSLLWTGAVFYVLYLVATRPEFAPDRSNGTDQIAGPEQRP